VVLACSTQLHTSNTVTNFGLLIHPLYRFFVFYNNTPLHSLFLFAFYYLSMFKVKEIEKQDSVLTPKQQIDRLTRPGATYFNLNPFDVRIIFH